MVDRHHFGTRGAPYLCTMTLAWLGAMVSTSAYDDSGDQNSGKEMEKNAAISTLSPLSFLHGSFSNT